MGGVDRRQRTVDASGECLESIDRLVRRAESGEIVQQRGLEDVDAVLAVARDDVADLAAGRDEVAAARVEPRSRALAGAERGGDRAVAGLIGELERRRRRPALAEQQMTLGDADVSPHERGVLPDAWSDVGHFAEAPDRLVGATRVAGDLAERHVEPDPRPHRARGEGAIDGRLEQSGGPRRSDRCRPARAPR